MVVKLDAEGLASALDLSPSYNVYVGRDTSVYALSNFAPSKTSQEFREDADINVLMARYVKTGVLPVHTDRQPFYVDADALPSFQTMQNVLIEAREAFMALPSRVRERFMNDPARFVEFATDEKNIDELRSMGLLSPEAVERLDAAKAAEAAKAAASAPGEPEKGGQEPSKPA